MSWQAFAFHAGIKSAFYAYAVKPVGPMIWAYEAQTGEDIPFLVEVGIQVGLPIGLGVMDEALSAQWKKKGHSLTWNVVKAGGRTVRGGFLGTKKAAAATTRALARGSVKVLTRVGFRIVPVLGLTMLAYDAYLLLKSDSFKQYAVQMLRDWDRTSIYGPAPRLDVPHPSTWDKPSWRMLPGAPQ